MTPSEIANKAFDTTLEVVQLLMKRCMKLKESDPAALIISDEIAKRVYGSIQKPGDLYHCPDWNSVMDNDPRIKTHPLFHKTVGYRPYLAYPDAEPESSMPSSAVPLEPHSTIGTVVEASTPQQLVTSMAPQLIQLLHVVPEVKPLLVVPEVKPLHVVPEMQLMTSEPPSPAAPGVEPMMSGVRSTITPMVIPELPPQVSIRPVTVGQNKGNIRTARQIFPPTGNQQKRKMDDSEPEPRRASRKPVPKRKRKFESDEEETNATGTIHVKDMPPSDFVDDRGFWDAETRPAGWGLDATVATSVEHSVRYHPRKCDKCINMDVPCIVLPDKKFGFTRLACANCDEMKITCAIDGAGVRQRLQAKAQGAAKNTGSNAPLKRSRTRAPKSRAAVTAPVASAPVKRTKLSKRSSSLVLQKGLPDNPPIEVGQGQMNLMPDGANLQAPPNHRSFHPVPAAPSEPEPTARAILQSIHDLGRRFDLLATNERMDALDVRVDSVERKITLRLTALEERFAVSIAHQESLSQSIGNHSMSLRVHSNNPGAHFPRADGSTHPPRHLPEPTIMSWLTHNHAGDEHPGISTIDREYTHAWDQSLTTGMQGDAQASTSSWRPTYFPDPPYIHEPSIASSPLSSM
ncbi:uncharacterized protein F5891DRAFT_985587 [Suillus fuscotomentosus]|uniref:Uncharacterized protein n=1 Tax=Suillus fuscotomentosus TaxID=1912939 RepID=A0AAD4HF09_9AGAM|nr:uncharacterized protein F5891DRAFT_985587 [Suillus fuscotomentosus]KAG1893771.1 hypothetical protein F5891DRAFT_985587 [Suillus fuscotomentosus]